MWIAPRAFDVRGTRLETGGHVPLVELQLLGRLSTVMMRSPFRNETTTARFNRVVFPVPVPPRHDDC